MPAFVVVPATPEDLVAVARIEFDACASDPGFATIFPLGGTPAALQHLAQQHEADMEHDRTSHLMLVRDAFSGELASFAVWRFYAARSPEEIERDMLADHFPLPAEANAEVGNRLIAAGQRKRHEVVAAHLGMGMPYAFLSSLGTSPKYQKQGAAALLVSWGIERTDDYGLSAYVESTPAARGLYQKYGFKEVDRLRLDVSPWKEGDFFNVCMIRPASTG